MTVTVSIQHSFVSDLTLTLIGPNGQRVLLVSREGGDRDDFDRTVFDDNATVSISNGVAPYRGYFRPVQPLSDFAGSQIESEWVLEVQDNAVGDGGVLTTWRLFLDYTSDGLLEWTDDTRAQLKETSARIKAIKQAMAFIRCMDGQWADTARLFGCSGVHLPAVPGPIDQSDATLMEDLMARMTPDDRSLVEGAFLRAHDRLVTEELVEIAEIGAALG